MAAIRDFRPTDVDAEASADAVDLAKRHLVQPWPFAGSIGTEARSLIGSGDGIYLIDGDGKRLIDGPAGMWCVNVGHRREELARVMYDQAMQLSYNTPWYTMNGPSAELAGALPPMRPAISAMSSSPPADRRRSRPRCVSCSFSTMSAGGRRRS